MQRIEVVTYLTKRFDDVLKNLIVVEKVEVYPLGKAYGGRPFAEWNSPENYDGWAVVMLADHFFFNKKVIKQTFKVVSGGCSCDPRYIDKLTVYKQFSDTEFERLFIWLRGEEFKTKPYEW